MHKWQRRVSAVITVVIFLAALNFLLLTGVGLFVRQLPLTTLIPGPALSSVALLIAGFLLLSSPRSRGLAFIANLVLVGIGAYFLLRAMFTFIELGGSLLGPGDIGLARTPLLPFVIGLAVLIGLWNKSKGSLK